MTAMEPVVVSERLSGHLNRSLAMRSSMSAGPCPDLRLSHQRSTSSFSDLSMLSVQR